MEIEEIKRISILDYLSKRGVPYKQSYNRYYCKSPVTRDSNWSLIIYPQTNSFYDWSAGYGGSIIDLAMAMESCSFRDAVKYLEEGHYQQYTPNYKSSKLITKKQFEYTRYLTTDPIEIAAIKAYADSRRIYGGFEYGVYFLMQDGSFQRIPSLMFLHRNVDNHIVGAKFRNISPNDTLGKGDSNRFSARGAIQFYSLEYVDMENFGETTLYVVEGEANANSLWQYCQDIRKNAVVISFGGVGNLPISLPTKYQEIQDKRLIIDYDGTEDLYSFRIEKYRKYELTPVKLILPKGEDINSLYIKDEMNLIKNLLIYLS